MATRFKLRCNLTGHKNDVRALALSIYPENGLISGSRDNTSCVWVESQKENTFNQELVLKGHSGFVSCVCVIPPDDNYPYGLIATGSNDKTILLYTPDNPQPVCTLTGHHGNVCALVSGKFGFIVSGSWDTTARVWLKQKCVMTLEGHQAAVWTVGVVSGQGITLTGSADKTIKAWKAGKNVQTYRGHDDCVRALGVINDGEFLSCSNDATVRRWAVETGECLAIYYGHTNYVYSLSILPNGQDFITGGEDRTLRIWQEGRCIQTIYHPCESVWAVCALPNGDVATGASDGIVRIFTQASERVASQEVLEAYEVALANAPVASQPLGDIKVEDLPGPESLQRPGKKDGQTTMVNNEGSVDVYQWDAAQGKWVKIGNVVGSSGGTQRSSGKTLYEGKEYDYVFSVDIKEGSPALKLAYNISEDPWMAAQKFLYKYDLSQAFLDQVANFIIENTKGVTLGTGSVYTNADPFTGGDRYVPGKDENDAVQSDASDPFTGPGRYIPDGRNNKDSGNNHFPMKDFIFFDSVSPAEQIIGKLKEFNRAVDSELQVPEDSIDKLVSLLSGSTSDGATAVLEKILIWPIEYVFPALDILRTAIKRQDICRHFCSQPGYVELLCQSASQGNPSSCRMLVMRTFTNHFRYPEGVEINMRHIDAILTSAISCKDFNTKNAQVAAASLIFNYCVKLSSQEDLENKSKCLQAIGELLTTWDPEAIYRLLVAIGTLTSNDDGCKALAHSIDLPSVISKFQSSDFGKVAECARLLAASLS